MKTKATQRADAKPRFTRKEKSLLAKVAKIEASPNPRKTAKNLGMEWIDFGEIDSKLGRVLERCIRKSAARNGLSLAQQFSLTLTRAIMGHFKN